MHITRSVLQLALGLTLSACGPEESDEPLGPRQEPSPNTAAAGEVPYAAAGSRHHFDQACTGRKHRQFDFWVGKWNIENPADILTGTSVVTRELNGCVVMEDFIANGGFRGRSLNVYDAREGRWYESFVDNFAGNYRLSGGLQGADMVMTADQPAFTPGAGVRQRTTRVTWTPLAGGKVHQVFDESFDGGPTARTFDGLYLKTGEPERATPSDPGFCRTTIPGARQLDFWVGEWKVSAERGGRLGRSAVSNELAGCLVEENFTSRNGFRSRSFLFYDFTVGRWFRTYADNTGGHYELAGGLEGDRMVLTGEEVLRSGRKVMLRVTIAPANGGVRQTVEVSRNGGTSWREDLVLSYAR
jgi:hypothetical protein